MTSVTRPVRRLTPASHFSRGRRKNVVVELRPPGNLIYFRLAGERRSFALSVSDCYAIAVQAHVRSEKLRKKAEREERKKLRQR